MIGNATLIAKGFCYLDGTDCKRYFFFWSNGEVWQQDEGRKAMVFQGGWPFALADCLEVFNDEMFHRLFAEWED